MVDNTIYISVDLDLHAYTITVSQNNETIKQFVFPKQFGFDYIRGFISGVENIYFHYGNIVEVLNNKPLLRHD